LVEVIESPEEIFLVTEYLAGGQVLERICKRPKYNERVATKILKQLLEGLKVRNL
jgi:serine/threonine protein kinase